MRAPSKSTNPWGSYWRERTGSRMMIDVANEIGSRTPTPVGSLLSAALPKLAERLREVQIRREWPDLVGREIDRRCRPGELRNGTLELIVDNSPWLQELTLREPQLLSLLTTRYGPHAVRSLRLTLGSLPTEPPAPLPERDGRATGRPTAEEMRVIDSAASLIPDPEIRGSARRVLEKACIAMRARRGRP